MRFFCLLLGAIFLTFKLSAEETDSLNTYSIGLEEVVIQSFKHTDKTRTLPIAASMINKQSLQNQNVLGIKDISSFIPNLFMPDYGSKLTSPVYIRGIGSRINAPSVGLYVDGIPYFEKSAFDFDLNEIDYIEVLRGPQGTLYGRNTMGGLINVFTKSPLRYKETFVSTTLSSYSNFNHTLANYGKINDKLGYAISGNFNHSGGYFTNQYTGRKADVLDAGSGRIRLEWAARPDLLLKLTHTFDYSDQGGYPYAVLDQETNKIGDVNYDKFSSYKRTMSSTGLSLIYSTNRFSLNSQTAYQYLSDKQGIDQDFSPVPNFYAKQNQKQSSFTEEVNIKSNYQSWYQWLFGAFAFYQQIDNEVAVDYIAQNYSTQKLYDIPNSGISLYHQSIFNNVLIDRLSITMGVRYDYEKASNDYVGYRHTADASAQYDDFFSKLSFSQITPKFTLQYSLPSSQLFYTSITKGYKTGGFNSSFEKEEDRSFDPEYSWNYEIGAKTNFWQDRIRAELCFFYIDWENQQIYRLLSTGIGSMLKNAGRSESKGFEFSLQANLWEGFTLSSNLGVTKAVFKENVQSSTIDYSGNYLPMVPDKTLGLAANYRIPLRSQVIDDLTFNLQYTGTGKLYWNEDNKVSHPYYGLLNGKVSASRGITTVSLWAKNITSAEYSAFCFASQGKLFAQKGRPFTAGVSVNLLIK